MNKKNIVYVGIDQSLTNTGVVILNSKGKLIDTQTWITKLRGTSRLEFFYLKVRGLVDTYGTQARYAMEGYSYSKFNTAVLGELGGVIRLAFIKYNIEPEIYPPTTIKKFATGSGTAKKSLMIKTVYKRWGVDVSDDNIADAMCIAKLLYHNYTEGVVT